MAPAARPARSRWPVVGACALWALTVLGLGAVLWLQALLRGAGRGDLAWLGAASLPEAVAALSAASVGALLASRRPAHPVGWLLLGLGVSIPVAGVASSYAHYGVMVRPGGLPAAAYLGGIANGVAISWLGVTAFVLLLTPTGSLPSPRWRWSARVVAVAAAVVVVWSALDPNPLYPEDPTFHNPLTPPDPVSVPLGLLGAAGAFVLLAGLVAGAVSLVVRFRRARGVERLQLRWLAVGAALAAVALAVTVVGVTTVETFPVDMAGGVCLAILPLATGAAILRYRLYDLDRIISRTLAYGLLTVLLGGAYAAVVLGLGQLLGRDRSLLVAGATLALAAAFQPARRRIQQVVDRRFNRRRYDAARTIQAFSARLREQVDLDTLTAELLGVVEQTMQPTGASLWLRPQGPADARVR